MKAIHRLFEYIKTKDIKPTRLEKEIGLSNGYLGTQLKRGADLGEGVLNKIIDYCLDINPEWLLTGEGEMLKTNCTKFQNMPAIPATLKADNEFKGTNNNDSVQENAPVIDKLLLRLENQSEEIGRLKSENKFLRKQLSEKNTDLPVVDEDASCAAVG